MRKVGILTFHWADDLGALLQAYALKNSLIDLGYEACIIPYSKAEFTGRYLPWPYYSMDGRKCSLHGWGQIKKFKTNMDNKDVFFKRRKSMSDFRSLFLTSKGFCNSPRKLGFNKYDAVLIGSDQVWNPQITVGFDDYYLGDFPKKEDCKVISYAASFGKEALSLEEGIILGKCLDENFYAVSVREKSAVPFVRSVTQKKVFDMPDPALLCTKKVWERLAEKADIDIKEKYLVYHSTQENEEMRLFAKYLSEAKELKVIDIRKDILAGPLEFLKIMSNAEYVVTDSFHATVFSILMEKPMAVFSHKDNTARLADLMDICGLQELLSDKHNVLDVINKTIDWESVRKRIEYQRNKGLEFLKAGVEGEL